MRVKSEICIKTEDDKEQASIRRCKNKKNSNSGYSVSNLYMKRHKHVQKSESIGAQLSRADPENSIRVSWKHYFSHKRISQRYVRISLGKQ